MTRENVDTMLDNLDKLERKIADISLKDEKSAYTKYIRIGQIYDLCESIRVDLLAEDELIKETEQAITNI